MDKKGQIGGSVWMVFILAGVLLGIIILFWVFSLIGPPVVSSVDRLSTNVQVATGQNEEIGTTFNNTAIPVSQAIHSTEWIGYGALISLLFGYFIILFYVRSYPFLIYIWLGLIVVLVILSIFLANAYNSVSGLSIGETSYESWKANDYILGNLPMIVAAMGLFGGVVLFALVSRDSEVGESL